MLYSEANPGKENGLNLMKWFELLPVLEIDNGIGVHLYVHFTVDTGRMLPKVKSP